MKNLLLVIFCIMQSFAIIAHEDTPIKLKEDGSLKGLPEQYSPSNFDRTSFTLTIGKNRIVIPECVKAYFKHYENFEITFSSSWYHDPELLPNYIHMDIVTEEEPFGYQIFFNLETLEIYQILKPEMILNKDKANQYYFNEQEISEECHDEISNSIVEE